jgi:hypothetical protein
VQLLGVELEARQEGEGCKRIRELQPSASMPAGAAPRRFLLSLPYFAVSDIAEVPERVEALGGSVVHPGEARAICMDSEGSPFGLARESLGA